MTELAFITAKFEKKIKELEGTIEQLVKGIDSF